MTQKIYIGDTGTVIALDCVEDISLATELSIAVRKPDGSLVTWAGLADGVTGVKFLTTADTLDQPGNWLLQAVVALPGGLYRGATTNMRVFPLFK